MNDSLFVSLDRLLLEFVFQYEQDISTKEDIVQRINKCFEDIKEYKATVCKIHETINTTDEEIGHYCKHSKEIKDNCSNWKPTCDVFHKHEDYMQEQFIIYQETIEKDNTGPSTAPTTNAEEAEVDWFCEDIQQLPVLNDSAVNNHPKCTHVMAFKNSQNVMQFRLVTPQKQSNCSQWLEKRDTDAECEDKGTIRQLPESNCASQITYAEHFGKQIESNSDEVERAGIFPRTSEIPLFLRTPEDVKTPDSVEKLPKTPSFEMNKNRNTATESQTQKDSPGFSFLMSYTSQSPGLNLFDSSVFDSEISSHQFSEHYSSGNLNPLSSQQEIGNLFGKPEREDAFTFSFPSDSSTHTFGAGRDDFRFPFSFEQDQNSALSSVKGFSSTSQNTTQFTFF
ncbi:protein SIX6OS1 [Oryx dammah]|uniref:protein SIX6OS1 n=1 Tax=Oryx dammah TaxID=59534 RepID=UPI001A9BD630|nr:protein SIX6OS1 [Oryx dammah]